MSSQHLVQYKLYKTVKLSKE